MRVIVALIFIGLTSVMDLTAGEATPTAPLPLPGVSDSNTSRVDSDGWMRWFSSELRAVDSQRTILRTSLDRLGAPVIGQTAPQFGHQNQRLTQTQPPLTPPWVQVDLQEEVAIDRIALIPAVLDWQSDTKRTYGFPPRFRIDIASNAEFTDPVSIADFTDHDQPDPGIAPLVVRVEHRRARYVRVTITKLVIETGQYFYALGELMVLSGQRNVAINRPITSSSGMNIPPRWTQPNLVDGRTALGPPIHVELLKWDGLFAGPATTEPFTFMTVDLGKEFVLQEVRIYAIHAWLGADIPGFSFPLRFRVEAARSADFSDAVTILNARDADYPNPGDNAITIRASGITARHVRVALRNGDKSRFGLSEIEVYANDHNVAREGSVTSTADPSSFSGIWPRSLLVDGFTSYGRLMELPDWLDEWDQRAQWSAELRKLDEQRPRLLSEARQNVWWTGGSVAALTMIAASILMVASRRRRARELNQLRRRLARDLHDEIGSNLAAIARLSELGAGQEQVASVVTAAGDWNEVNRIAHESMDGMREILWLAGAREESGPDLSRHLLRLVERMLGGVEVRWTAPLEALPTNWQPAARRELFLMVKEALTNVVRHAQAKFIELGFVVDGAELRLEIRDHGKGFDLTTVRDGMGLSSLRERARTLGGKLIITSVPGTGTTILFTVPVAKLQASASGSARTSSVSSLS